MKLVFLAHPVRGNIEANMESMKKWARLAIEEGYIPIAPYFLLTEVLNDLILHERELGMEMGKTVLSKCDLLWVCGEKVTTGMTSDISAAQTYRIRVVYKASDQLEKLNVQ